VTDQATFQLQVVESVPLIAVAGEIDLSNVAQFKSFVADAASKENGAMVLSLSGVSYLDSHMLAAIVDLSKRLRTNRRRLAICAPQGSPAGRILRVTGIDSTIEVFETDDEALQSVK
jgi:anti-anti-sigma factor